MNGTVTTIIPVFNRSALLREAVASVIAQTYRPIEVIVVDDGSTDETPSVCAELAEAHPDIVRWTGQHNGGPGVARETGRQLARGEFIQYLDSDDLLHPKKFELQVASLLANPDCGASYCYTRYYRIGEAPHAAPWKGSGHTVEAMFPSFLLDRWWDTPTPLYRRSVCDAAGAWSDLRLEEDWEYDCRIAALGTRLVHCREYLVDVRDHAGDRLCEGAAHDPIRNRDRARARTAIYDLALRAGINPSHPEMQTFARSLFLLARQCGASGLSKESRELFALARQASGPAKASRMDYLIYRAAVSCVGWNAMGKLACWLDRYRTPGPATAGSQH